MKKLLTILLLLFTVPALAAKLPEAQRFVLDNGLEVLVIENHRIPAATQMLWYHVGGADEERGKTGLAHYLEHLMFKATDNLQSGEFSKMVAWIGGNDNAFTTQDSTTYHQTFPVQHLPLMMLLESERMRNLQLTPETSLKERDVILEERSMRVDNQPASLLVEQLNAAMFGENHPYGVPVIGWRKDIEKLSSEDAKALYNRHYAPNNATLVIAGDVTAEEVKKLAAYYYGSIPATPNLPKRDILNAVITAPAPEQPVILHHPNVEQRQWVRYYLAPSWRMEAERQHTLPLVLFAHILGGGETSRLYQSLVMQQQIAIAASAYYDEMALGHSPLKIYITPKDGVDMSDIALKAEAEINHLLENGITAEELNRAKNLLKADAIYAQDSLENMAHIYGDAAATGTDLAYLANWVEQVEAVTPEAVLAAGKHVFRDKLRVVTGHLLPQEATP